AADGLTEAEARRVRHVLEETARVRQGVEAIRASDGARLGSLLDLSHASSRDLYRVSSPDLDALAAALREAGGPGGRPSGGGAAGGGGVRGVRRRARPGRPSRGPRFAARLEVRAGRPAGPAGPRVPARGRRPRDRDRVIGRRPPVPEDPDPGAPALDRARRVG